MEGSRLFRPSSSVARESVLEKILEGQEGWLTQLSKTAQDISVILQNNGTEILATKRRVDDLEAHCAELDLKVQRLQNQSGENQANLLPLARTPRELPNDEHDNYVPPHLSGVDAVGTVRRQSFTFAEKLRVIKAIERYMTRGEVPSNIAIQVMQRQFYQIRPCNIIKWWTERHQTEAYLEKFPEEAHKTRVNKIKFNKLRL